jgi:hypothetical protein
MTTVNRGRPIIFSPFGMGILDPAVASGQEQRLSDLF